MKDLFDLHQIFKQEKLVVCFAGQFNTPAISAILSYAETQLKINALAKRLEKKTFNVCIEALQNLHHHAIQPSSPETHLPTDTFFGIAKNEEEWHVISGNIINNSGAEKLEKMVSVLNSLSQSELQSVTLDRLSNDSSLKGNGAGLGLIRMRRTSGNPLSLSLKRLNENFLYLTLKVIVNEHAN